MNVDIRSSQDFIKYIESTFQEVFVANSHIEKDIKKLNEKYISLIDIYKILAERHKDHVTTLDIFNFQNKLIANDISHIYRKYQHICNRMYCQYYKLYCEICKFVTVTMNIPLESIEELSNVTPLQEYDDMRHDRIYEFTQIVNVQMQLCSLLRFLLDRISVIRNKNDQYDKIKDTGIHISSYVIAIKYTNQNIANNFDIYMNNLSSYNNCIFNYFRRLLATLEDTMKDILDTISFDKLYKHIDILDGDVDVDLDDDTVASRKIVHSLDSHKHTTDYTKKSGEESDSDDDLDDEYSNNVINKLINGNDNDNDLSDIELDIE